VAVKALVDAALPNSRERDLCKVVATARYDGHKGRALSFDASTGELRQPLYLVRRARNGAEELVGEIQ
jgi:hypothetical protein